MEIKKILKRAVKYILQGTPVVEVKPNIGVLDVNKLLDGRIALITGGNSGIGFEIAKAYLKAGASVVITGRSKDKNEKSVKELSAYGKCKSIEFDITNAEQIPTMLKEAINCFGRIDILVNNAGVSGAYISNATPDEFDKVLDTNLKGVFFLSQAVGKYMKENSISGNILNISSASSIRPAACAYTISKWGIRGFTLGLARTLLPYNITVNALAPGPTATPLLGKNGENDDLYLPNTPSKRYALPEEIANMAVVLVSDMGRLIIGDTIFMTGGAGNVNNGDINYEF